MAKKKIPTPGSPEAGAFCYVVEPEFLVKGEGYRASVVYENIPGHFPTGDWPYTDVRAQKLPLFWGPSFAEAKVQMDLVNQRIGVSPKGASRIISRSMGLG